MAKSASKVEAYELLSLSAGWDETELFEMGKISSH